MSLARVEKRAPGPAVHDHAHHLPHGHGHSRDGGEARPLDATALISARGLSLSRDGRTLIDHVDFDIHPGEIVTVIGPNGAGKTTLVRLLLGLMAPDAGKIGRAPGLRIGYAPQRFDIDRAIPLTVDRFLQLGGSHSDHAVGAALDEVGAARVRRQQLASLSGGELQRVVLARALLRKPNLLALDEPVRGVDYVGEAELYGLIASLRDNRKLAVLLVSHDLHVVMARSDRVVCINRHVCCSGVPQAVARDPEYTRLFGPDAARAFAVYTHEHDHRHDLTGAAEQPQAGRAGGEGG